MTATIQVLIVDDEAFVRDSLVEMLSAAEVRAHAVDGVEAALHALRERPPHVIVTDLSMPSGGGTALLREARARGAAIPIVVISGVGTLADAVLAMKSGAFDFLQKPVDPEQLLLVIRRAAEHHGLLNEVARLRDTLNTLRPAYSLVGGSPQLERVRAQIAQVAATDAAVLIRGESGAGKDVVADAIHRGSPRHDRTLLRVQCTFLSADQVEGELFGLGPTAGATERPGLFAQAEGGTLVLDGIEALPLRGQAQLLRLLETGEYVVSGEPRPRLADVRVLALTTADLAEQVKAGAFRADLLARLSIFPIVMPPLREHKSDIPELAQHFLGSPRNLHPAPDRRRALSVAPDALDVLASYDWPGNVRELRNALERAAIVSPVSELGAELFRSILEASLSTTRAAVRDEFHLRRNLDAAERRILLRALSHTHDQRREASARLGIDPRNLSYYLRKHSITEADVKSFRDDAPGA